MTTDTDQAPQPAPAGPVDPATAGSPVSRLKGGFQSAVGAIGEAYTKVAGLVVGKIEDATDKMAEKRRRQKQVPPSAAPRTGFWKAKRAEVRARLGG